MNPVEHPQSRIDAGLRGLLVATDGPELRVAIADEETGTASGPVAIVAHGASAAIIPAIVVPIPGSIPAVTAVVPPPAPIVIISG